MEKLSELSDNGRLAFDKGENRKQTVNGKKIAECNTLRSRYFCIRNSENQLLVFTSLIITQQNKNAILLWWNIL